MKSGSPDEFRLKDVRPLLGASVECMLPCVILFFTAPKQLVESVASTGVTSQGLQGRLV